MFLNSQKVAFLLIVIWWDSTYWFALLWPWWEILSFLATHMNLQQPAVPILFLLLPYIKSLWPFSKDPSLPSMATAPTLCITATNLLILLIFFLPSLVLSDCSCDEAEHSDHPINGGESLKYKLAAIASILVAGAAGVSIPLLGKKVPALNPENHIFFMIKAFAAGVILATGFIHILPEAFERLTSPCLGENPWGKFPFTGLVAMMSAIGTLMVDTFATGYYKRQHFSKPKQVTADEERGQEHAGHVHVHTHATHGHAHGSASPSDEESLSDLIRRRIVSQVRFEPIINSILNLFFLRLIW